ncbi:hypothetical protein MRB53_038578 [Persea americana]|nr:hypothetical protein MRB53_038578 [Persea americana]
MRGSPDYGDRRRDRSADSVGYDRKRSSKYDDSARSRRNDQDTARYRKRSREVYEDDSSRRRESRDRDDARHSRRHSSRDRHYRNGDRSVRPRGTSRSRSPGGRSRVALPSQNDSYRKDTGQPITDIVKQHRNFKPTGILAKEANRVAGTTTILKYHEPPEARKPPPSQQWRMYVFKEKDMLDTVMLFQRSCWLVGRDQHVTDLYLEHTSISKQHAVIQFRHFSTISEFGDKINKVKPYLIDLDSANGTELNGRRIEASRYFELIDGDVVQFGESEREYVMMLPPPESKS